MTAMTRRAVGPLAGGVPNDRPALLALLVAIAAAWFVMLAGELTSGEPAGHEHGLGPGPLAGLPPWLALASFLVSWQVMVVATMLPASLPSIRSAIAASGTPLGSRGRAAPFMAGFAGVWVGVGAVAFAAGHLVATALGSTSWLDAHPWLLQAAVIAAAGAYQVTPLKRRSLAACRHRGRALAQARPIDPAGLEAGVRHGLACLGTTWALMAVMLVSGLGGIWWMAALTVLMAYEVGGRHGRRVASVAGLLLLWLALLILLPGWLPA